ncbi:MAG: IcmT/TraK family protein [Alphaproteobacteria bacterium]
MEDHWRNSQRVPRFFIFDARAFIALMLFMVHIALWTFALSIIAIFAFWTFERFGLTFEAALRAIRSWILGRDRPALGRLSYRRWSDFG